MTAPIETGASALVLALSEPVQLALITASVPAFIAIIGLVTLWLNLKAASRKLTDIEAKVDGTASKALEKNEAQARELKEFMLSVLAEKEERARILATAAAEKMAADANRTRVIDPAPAASESLKNIDTQTAAIEKNTARTDAKIDELKPKE